MQIELGLRVIRFSPQVELPLRYKGRLLKCLYYPDLVCYDKIVIELKAVSELCDGHRAQLHNYLKGTGYRLGLLVNFGHFPQLEYERIVK
jgi:GxxExxY protein